MTNRPPLTDVEIEAGLDCLDEPWPPIKMERRLLGRRGRAWTLPHPPRGDGGQQQVYVPEGNEQRYREALEEERRQKLAACDALDAAIQAAHEAAVEDLPPGQIAHCARVAADKQRKRSLKAGHDR